MKKFLLLLNLTHFAFGQEIVEFKTGTSFGFCFGYCLSDLTITANNLDYILYGWDENDPVYLPVAINDTIDFTVWEDLNTQFNFESFMNLDSIIGCPDCADGGAEWFEIITIDTIRRVTIEYGASIDGLDDFINTLRDLRYGFQEVENCYFTPHVGDCDAAFQKYYFDQELQECRIFTWGGCGGLVPFDTMEECESDCDEFILEIDYTVPNQFHLYQNYPNPFNPVTTLCYDLPEDAMVNITIYDMMGRVVNTLINGSQTSGYKTIQWDATNDRNEPVSAGIYLYTIQAGEFVQTKKMVLLK
jgi:hypothetical protein